MSSILEVTFSPYNQNKMCYKVLRLFFGKYGHVEGEELKFPTQKAIADAIRKATKQKKGPSQSSVSKVLTKLEGKTLMYNGKSYQIGMIDGFYKLIDHNDHIEMAKRDLNKMRAYLGKNVFKNSAVGLSTVYAFKPSKEDISLKDIISKFKVVLGDSYFGVIKQKKIIFLFLNANSSSFKSDTKWLDDYFSRHE